MPAGHGILLPRRPSSPMPAERGIAHHRVMHNSGIAPRVPYRGVLPLHLTPGGVLVDLAGTLGGAAGDGALDTVTANGTAGNDAIRLFSFNGGQFNRGIGITPAGIVVIHQDATDQLIINGGAGNDTIDASAVVAGSMALTLDGGVGNDTIIGSAGNDTFLWNPGDGSDIVDGQA